VGEALAHALGARGDDCRLVGQGEAGVDPADPAWFRAALGTLATRPSSGPKGVLYLWPLDEAPGTPPAGERACRGLLHLAQAMATEESGRGARLWVVGRHMLPVGHSGAPLALGAATLPGLAKTIDLEHPELHCRTVDLGEDDGEAVARLVEELDAGGGEPMVAWRDGQRLVPRMIRLGERHAADPDWQDLPAGPSRLRVETRGTLDGLKLGPAALRPPGPGEVTIRVRAAGLNFRDVVSALGMIPDDDDPGLECAGTIASVGPGVADLRVGEDVLAVTPGALATTLTAGAALVRPMPGGLTHEEAATIPIAFLTAHYALVELARLQPGERVLIHAASGGVGLAAVQIAKACGAIVFGSAGTPAKRAFLSSIGVDQVLDSRSLEFADRIADNTGGAGVDVVLNSLSGDFIERSFAALRAGGRFIEIGKRDIWSTAQARAVRPDAFYSSFDLAGMIAREPGRVGSMLDGLLERFRSGELRPLPLTVLPMEAAVRAFRTMQQARHVGKIVVSLSPWSGGRTVDAPGALRSDVTWLVTGAFGGIGLALARWLADRGARHLALVGRRAPGPSALAVVADLETAGVSVRALACDIASEAAAERLFARDLAGMPPLGGVFHLAGALDDGALIQQSWSRFETVLAPKVRGAWNLHRLTRGMVLDCFVLFSSWASFLGALGQANHAAANAFLDALAWQRRAQGLAGLSINWGAWAEVGAAVKEDAVTHLARKGIGSFSPTMGLRALARLMSQGAPLAAVTPFDLARWRQASVASGRSPWFELLDQTPADAAVGGPDADVPDLRQALLSAAAGRPRALVMEDFLKEQVARTLRLPAGRVDVNRPFKSFGMDSLTALEFRNRVEAASGTTLSATLVWNYPTIGKLVPFLFEKMSLPLAEENAQTAGEDDEGLLDLLDEVEMLSEEQVKQLLGEP
jgi:NADPH:quinone reductase-like Zn-dependent oxidoreductase